MQPNDAAAVVRLPNEAVLSQTPAAFLKQSETKPSRSCYNLWPQGRSTQAIPYENVLSARVDASGLLTIVYAKPISKTKVQLTAETFNKSGKVESSVIEKWAKTLDEQAWNHGQITRNKRVKVLINPAGGTGSARKLWTRDIQPILEAAGCIIDVEHTTHKGHAVDIARDMNVMDYDVVVCCSGDGLPHEVFNGLGKRDDARLALAKIAVVQLPCGSGNAMSWNCFGTASPTLAALRFAKSVRMPLDLVSLTQHDPETDQIIRTLSFLSQSVGIIADVDLGTENLRWLGGTRFDVGFLIRVMRKTIYPVNIAVAVQCSTKDEVRRHYSAETEKTETLEPGRLNAALKEYQLRDQECEHAAYAGLPELRYGTAADPLPDGWTEAPFDNLGNFYSGNMTTVSAETPFFPAALPNDGVSDLITIRGDVSRSTAISMASAIPEYKFFDMPDVQYRKITGYRITPKAASGYISIDGEPIRHAAYQAEVHKALGTTMSRTGKRYEVREFR